jgi:toxin FitB
MKYLLDTCVISEFVKISPNSGVINWITNIDEDNLYISVITLGELEKGITKLSESKKKKNLQTWLTQLEKRFEERTLLLDKDSAYKWGQIQAESEEKGLKIPAIDALIAASAITNGMTIVTRNEKDLKRSGVKIFNPWD